MAGLNDFAAAVNKKMLFILHWEGLSPSSVLTRKIMNGRFRVIRPCRQIETVHQSELGVLRELL